MRRNLSTNTVLSILIVVAGMFCILQGCQKDTFSDREEIDQTVAMSSELEEYIIAASDYQRSLNAFTHEISKVDFLNLEIVKDSAGRNVSYLPESIRSLQMEKKAQVMTEKKEALLRKYPQFASWDFNKANDYVNYAVNHSVNINNKFLEFGFNKNMALTKSGTSEMFGTLDEALNYITSGMTNGNEAYIVIYYDGTKEIYVDDRNTPTDSYLQFKYNDGVTTRNGKRVQMVAHTHPNYSTPSAADKANAAKYPGLAQGIYHNGEFNWYNVPQ